ncbi:MAG: hypothetical protein IJX53_00630 [Clostridia bacterium]|nr:hypothetical protein [Clostridia bacterium]
MTDNEIIKALEYCSVLGNDRCDANCTMFYNGITTKSACMKKLHELSLDLINRQKAEIERLTINMNAFGLGMKREKERADTARAEAIKEFAERLESNFGYGWVLGSAVKTHIDNLAKEMTEETTKYILNREATT